MRPHLTWVLGIVFPVFFTAHGFANAEVELSTSSVDRVQSYLTEETTLLSRSLALRAMESESETEDSFQDFGTQYQYEFDSSKQTLLCHSNLEFFRLTSARWGPRLPRSPPRLSKL